ncbi:MAG: hypothetical protein ACK4IS_05610 [Erythrobacter sp.]
MIRTLIALALIMVLAACQGESGAGTSEMGGRAEGEVLGGTISDDMIALEQLTSEAPLAPREGPSPAAMDAAQPVVAGEMAPADPPAAPAPLPPPATE